LFVVAVMVVVPVAGAAVGLTAALIPTTAALAAPACAEDGEAPGDPDCPDAKAVANSMIRPDSCTTFAKHPVCGLILERYVRLRGPDGFLGLPTSDQLPAGADGGGRVSHFQGGAIYWSLDSGAWETHGRIARKWADTGGTDGALGYPTTNAQGQAGVEWGMFETGSVAWSAGTGAHAVLAAISDGWWDLGGPRGPLGLPVTDTVPAHGGRQVTFFQGGTLYWSQSRGLEVYVDRSAAPLAFEAETIVALPLADFAAVWGVRSGGSAPGVLVWSSDGCSGGFLTPPTVDGLFRDACHRHDFGYRNFRNGPRIDPSAARKRRIDDMFLADLQATCAAAGQPRVAWHHGISVECLRAAQLMYRAVRAAP
jgi:uncharacterized protein with LGFP repeats